MEYFAVEAKERMLAGKKSEPSGKITGGSASGESREKAAKALGISARMVQAGKAIANLGVEPISYY